MGTEVEKEIKRRLHIKMKRGELIREGEAKGKANRWRCGSGGVRDDAIALMAVCVCV